MPIWPHKNIGVFKLLRQAMKISVENSSVQGSIAAQLHTVLQFASALQAHNNYSTVTVYSGENLVCEKMRMNGCEKNKHNHLSGIIS